MARETQRISHFPLHGDPRIGAADAAPTAPHATHAPNADASGPAKFWKNHRVRLVLALTIVFSMGLHSFLTPWDLPKGIGVKDNDDELTIPIDLVMDEAPPAEPPPPKEDLVTTQQDPNGTGSDGGVRRDAGMIMDAATPLASDGGTSLVQKDGGVDLIGDGGVASAGDGGTGTGAGPSDPGGMIGMPGLISAGEVNVTLLVNVSVIRSHPVGKKLGPMVNAIPQWASFMKGSNNAIDPINDTDWILIWGPSLIHTDRDAVIVRYSVADSIVDSAVENIANSYDKGGELDAGVPGVKAWKGHADNAERAFLRAQPGVLVIVPPKNAEQFAKVMSKKSIAPKVRPTEALRLTVKNPSKQIAIPGLKFQDTMKEIRLWIVPRKSDNGADIFAEADCTDEAAAADAEQAFTALLKQYTTGITGSVVSGMTGGLLRNAKLEVQGKKLKAEINADESQLQTTLDTVKGLVVKTKQGGP